MIKIGTSLAAAACCLLVLAGCSGTDAAGGTPSAPASSQPGGGPGAGGGQRQPGVSGKIADLAGKTLQVQGTSGQTAVTYNAKTAISETVAAAAKDLKVGLCASVRSTEVGSASPAASPSDQVNAASVTLTAATDGSCAGGFGGGQRPSGAPSGRPSGAPSDAPSGGPGGGRGFGANGQVRSVDGASFVVESDFGQATTITVTTTADTTWSQIAKASAKAIVVGQCATAQGSTDDTGAMTARSLRISKPIDGACSTGRPGRGNG